MLRFRIYNANPKGKKTGDCAIRAVANILGITWDEALDELVSMSHKTKYDPTDRKNVTFVMKAHGWVKLPRERKPDGTYYEVRELDALYPIGMRSKGILVSVANHLTTIVGDHYEDTWDCGRKASGNVWVKGR